MTKVAKARIGNLTKLGGSKVRPTIRPWIHLIVPLQSFSFALTIWPIALGMLDRLVASRPARVDGVSFPKLWAKGIDQEHVLQIAYVVILIRCALIFVGRAGILICCLHVRYVRLPAYDG